MKRLLCLLSSMNAGGAETFLMKIYRRMDKSKYQMDFCINVREKCFYEDEILAMGGKIFRIPSKSENTGEFKRQLTAVVRNGGYDHVMRITSSAMGFMDLKIAHKAGAKVCAARSSNSSDGGGVKAYVAHRLGRLLYNRYVDVKLAPSDLAARYTFGDRAYEDGRVAILHNGVDVDRFAFRQETADALRQELGLTGKFVVGHIGRFSKQKNHAFLLEIFAEIVKKRQDAVLLLVGGGELEAQIRSRTQELGIADKVVFAGVRSDVPAVLSAMDTFLFQSFYEGMPNTVIEAQANGLHCTVSDTITKGANITGAVQYLPLTLPAGQWAQAVLETPAARMEPAAAFIRHQYDIDSVTAHFVELIFGKDAQ